MIALMLKKWKLFVVYFLSRKPARSTLFRNACISKASFLMYQPYTATGFLVPLPPSALASLFFKTCQPALYWQYAAAESSPLWWMAHTYTLHHNSFNLKKQSTFSWIWNHDYILITTKQKNMKVTSQKIARQLLPNNKLNRVTTTNTNKVKWKWRIACRKITQSSIF